MAGCDLPGGDKPLKSDGDVGGKPCALSVPVSVTASACPVPLPSRDRPALCSLQKGLSHTGQGSGNEPGRLCPSRKCDRDCAEHVANFSAVVDIYLAVCMMVCLNYSIFLLKVCSILLFHCSFMLIRGMTVKSLVRKKPSRRQVGGGRGCPWADRAREAGCSHAACWVSGMAGLWWLFSHG